MPDNASFNKTLRWQYILVKKIKKIIAGNPAANKKLK